MNKDFKRCPRCGFKTPSNMARCGNCLLNFEKFSNATTAEAKSAFRMGEKERVLYSRNVPSDINKWKFLLTCLLGGWFGLHYFKLGKIWRALFQICGLIFAFVYTNFAVTKGIRTGYLGNLIFVCGIIWASSFVIWVSNTFSILFNRFKYPVSLPYSDSKDNQNTENKGV
ncbi:MAG: hypothetical protein ACLRFE_04070 [Clostridia bacterium]